MLHSSDSYPWIYYLLGVISDSFYNKQNVVANLVQFPAVKPSVLF